MEHIHTGLQMCATGWTKISQVDGLEEEIHRIATSPGLLDLSWHQRTIFCGDTYIKRKEYDKNYENISDLISAIISAFQEVLDGMVTLIMENFGRRLEIALRNKGGNFEK